MPESNQERRHGTIHLKSALEVADSLADVELQTEAEKATRTLAGFYRKERELHEKTKKELTALKQAQPKG